MPVELLNPNSKNPEETHQYNLDTEIRVGENWGFIYDRGYTSETDIPTYAYVCDDNIQRTCIESEIDEVVS